MQTYSATIRLGGSLFNEVRKDELTPAEIVVLKTIHGGDAILRIIAGKHVDRDDEAERARLVDIYGNALANIKGVGSINFLLGAPGAPLPKSVPGVDSLPPPKAGKRAKPADAETPVEGEGIEPTEFA